MLITKTKQKNIKKGRACFVVLMKFIVKGGEIFHTYAHHILHNFFCVLGMCFVHIFLDLLLILLFTFSFQNLENLKVK